MTLVVLLITLGLQRYLGFGADLPRLNWFKAYLTRLQNTFKKSTFWHSVAGIILIILPILILVGLIEFVFSARLFGVLKFIFELIIVWYCIDAYHLKPKLNRYFTSLAKQDLAASQQHAEDFVSTPASQTSSAMANSSLLARAVTREIFILSNEKLFAALFWYIIVGPIGIVAYYLVVLLRNYAAEPDSEFVEFHKAAEQLFGVLDWIPVRVLGFSYALVGHFVTGFNYCRQHLLAGIKQTREFAVNAGMAALNIEHVDVIHADVEENHEALALVDRAVLLWIVFVAIFTLGGWLR